MLHTSSFRSAPLISSPVGKYSACGCELCLDVVPSDLSIAVADVVEELDADISNIFSSPNKHGIIMIMIVLKIEVVIVKL